MSNCDGALIRPNSQRRLWVNTKTPFNSNYPQFNKRIFALSARSGVKLAGIFCATLRWSGVMLSQVVPQWFHKWGAIARCGATHLLAAAITTFFRLAETPQFDRGRAIRRTTTDNTRIFTRFQFNCRRAHFGGILADPNWRPFEFLSGQIFVFIDTEFVKILEVWVKLESFSFLPPQKPNSLIWDLFVQNVLN